MRKPVNEDARLVEVTKICCALPQTTRDYNGQHASFLVRRKTFAYYLDNHHGDGIVAIACKVLPDDNVRLARTDPTRFYLPPYIGPRGWVALRLDVREIDWEEVSELLIHSYTLIAPKRLSAIVEATARQHQ